MYDQILTIKQGETETADAYYQRFTELAEGIDYHDSFLRVLFIMGLRDTRLSHGAMALGFTIIEARGHARRLEAAERLNSA